MGYRGKLVEQQRARELRAKGWTYSEIQAELGVSRSSVSLWVRDVAVEPALLGARRRARWEAGNLSGSRRPSSLHLAKVAEIERCAVEARVWLGDVSDRDLFIAGIALYAGEGTKRDGSMRFANSDPAMIALYLRWLRRFFAIDESRLRLRLYLHDDLDLAGANEFWAEVTGIPMCQFGKPYRARANPSIRRAKHPMGCPAVVYNCARTHRTVSGLQAALLHSAAPVRGSSIGGAADC